MKFIIALCLSISLIFSVTLPTFAEDLTSSKDSLPQIHGEAAYLIDVGSGETLFMKNPDKQLAPASTTKIMTGLLAFERGNLDDSVTASTTMLNNKLVYGTRIYLEPGETMTLRNLLYAMLLNSANDAAVDIAEHIGGDLPHFVELMNARAQEIGATKTHFLNPSGLTETGHVTTAHDLALIARVAYQNPLFAQYVRTKSQTISRSKPGVPTLLINENKLLWRDADVDGIKTGYTAVAQNCLVASVTKNGRQFIGVILKSPGAEIYPDMQSLFDYGFTQFKDTVFKPAGSVISSITVNNQKADLILDRPILMTQKLNQQPPTLNMHIIPTYSKPLTSIEEGQVVAQVEVRDGNTLLNTYSLKSSRTIIPQPLNKSLKLNSQPWMTGLVYVGVVLSLLFSRKLYADYNWRKRTRLLRRREIE